VRRRPFAGSATPRTLVAFETGCPHRKRLDDWYGSQGAPERVTD